MADRGAAAAGLLGLAARAGQVVSGDFAAERAIRDRDAALVLLDADVSPHTREKYESLGERLGLPVYSLEAGMLGRAIGKPGRMTAVVRSGTLAGRIRNILEDTGVSHSGADAVNETP
jgi:ribosomal protein L7Ae-like RNA K-turn-binding protein